MFFLAFARIYMSHPWKLVSRVVRVCFSNIWSLQCGKKTRKHSWAYGEANYLIVFIFSQSMTISLKNHLCFCSCCSVLCVCVRAFFWLGTLRFAWQEFIRVFQERIAGAVFPMTKSNAFRTNQVNGQSSFFQSPAKRRPSTWTWNCATKVRGGERSGRQFESGKSSVAAVWSHQFFNLHLFRESTFVHTCAHLYEHFLVLLHLCTAQNDQTILDVYISPNVTSSWFIVPINKIEKLSYNYI